MKNDDERLQGAVVVHKLIMVRLRAARGPGIKEAARAGRRGDTEGTRWGGDRDRGSKRVS